MDLLPKTKSWLAAAILICPLLACSSPEPPRVGGNLLLISIDTLRPDRMSLYGGPRETTPTLERLARSSVRFDSAFSPSPWTLPAHASMLSGRYPSSLAADPNDERLYRVAPLLAERFQGSGYRTAGFAAGGFLDADFGVDAGFETYEEAGVERAVEWLQANGDAPFFLFFHTYEVHQPYMDRRYAADLPPGRFEAIYTEADTDQDLHTDICCRALPLSEEEKRFILALYDGGIARADEMVGEFLATLESMGLMDDTAIIVTSDHGEEFWEHTGRGAYHGHTLYDELLRVPLVWYEPDGIDAGGVVDAPVSLVDFVPTVVSRFDLDGGFEPVFDGLDVSPLLEGRQWRSKRPMFGEAVAHGPARYSVETGLGKLIKTPNPKKQRAEGKWMPVPTRSPHEFYLPDDPGEQENRYDESPRQVKKLERVLNEHWEQAAKTDPEHRLEPLDPEVLERLRDLGYVQ